MNVYSAVDLIIYHTATTAFCPSDRFQESYVTLITVILQVDLGRPLSYWQLLRHGKVWTNKTEPRKTNRKGKVMKVLDPDRQG